MVIFLSPYKGTQAVCIRRRCGPLWAIRTKRQVLGDVLSSQRGPALCNQKPHTITRRVRLRKAHHMSYIVCARWLLCSFAARKQRKQLISFWSPICSSVEKLGSTRHSLWLEAAWPETPAVLFIKLTWRSENQSKKKRRIRFQWKIYFVSHLKIFLPTPPDVQTELKC